MRKPTFRLMAVLAAGALALSACGGDDGGDEGDGGDGTAAGEGGDGITVGIKFDQPGLGVMEDDVPSGMGVDIAKHIAGELGHEEGEITWKEAPSPQREDLLETGQVDLIVATYSITEEREQRVQFAGPYFVAGQDLLVRADDDSITGPDDLGDKILCSVTGSTSAANVQEQYGGNLQEYNSYSECVTQLLNGTVDTLTTDDTILAGYAAQEQYTGQLRVVGNVFSEENYGVGLQQGDERCEQINEILTAMWEDGTMEQIIDDNLGAADYTPDDSLNPPEPGGHCG